MPHQHQEILIKVPCSERLPSELGAYVTDLHLLPYDPDEGRWMFDLKPSYWYEPATAIVLSVEEYDSAMRAAYLNGYQAANGYKP